MDSRIALNHLHPSFHELFQATEGQTIWECLNKAENKIRAETAAYLGKSPLDALTPELLSLSAFSLEQPTAQVDRLKQLTGSLIRILMDSWGYDLNPSKQRLPNSTDSKPQLFKTASTYIKRSL